MSITFRYQNSPDAGSAEVPVVLADQIRNEEVRGGEEETGRKSKPPAKSK